MPLDPRDAVTLALRRHVDHPTWLRGVDVERAGKVLRAALTYDASTLEAQVRGSGRETYKQVVTVRRHLDGRPSELRGLCSCPVGIDCKHVVAACLSVAEALAQCGGRRSVPAPHRNPSLDPNVANWLRRVETAAREPEDAEAYPSTVRDRLFYVVAHGPSGAVTLEPWKARLNKDDGVGGRPVHYDPGNVDRGQRAKFIRPSDETICRDIARLRRGYGGPGLSAQTLRAALATGRARWGGATGLALSLAKARSGAFVWEEAEGGAQRLVPRDGDGRAVRALSLEPPWYIDPETGETGPFETGLAPALAAIMAAAPVIPAEAAEDVAGSLAGCNTNLPAPRTVALARRKDIAPVPILTLSAVAVEARLRSPYGQSVEIDLTLPVLEPTFAYAGAGPVAPHEGRSAPAPIRHANGDGVTLIERQAKAEAEALLVLGECAAAHGILAAPRSPMTAKLLDAPHTSLLFDAVTEEERYRVRVAPQEAVDEAAIGLIAEAVPALRAKGWRVEEDESWSWRLHEGPLDFAADVERSGVDWFAFSLTVTAGDETLDLLPVILSVIDILPVDGEGALPEDFDLDAFLEDLVLYPQLETGARVRLDAGRLAPIVRAFLEIHGLTGFHIGEAPRLKYLAEALEGCGVPWRGDPAILTLAEKLNALAAAPEADPPASLTAILRPYQKAGFGWLKALSETGFGGALADDMGLGKTVQALALLAHRHLEEGSERPSLLVAPTSLVRVWSQEAARFAPNLRVLVLHGPERLARFGEIDDHHLIVTTYPLLHRDHEALFARAYDLAILDEAQAVKNPASSNAKRIREIEARQRLALTGTPVENNLQELWAIFDWLIPGLLGDRRRFASQIRTPIERDGSVAAQRLLSSRLRPFLLRRTKEEVAADLPPKTVIDEPVALGMKQAALYETLRVAMDARVKKAIKARGVAGSRITILDALLKLRQACCDPALVKLDAARKVSDSAKRVRLMALLDELMAEGRKVLVFSQFVEMLKLIEADVSARGWDYAMLTGRTQRRVEQIERFQEGKAPLFLISLKAGGTGLTLTEADTVILYDPWWNPAVERQAMDRAHRIGQTKPVFVHRLLATGTVEAAIQQMQARKQALADALFNEDAGARLDLGEDDIAALFAPIR